MDRRGKSINALHQPCERLSSESFSFFISRLFKEHSGCFPHVLKLYAIYIYLQHGAGGKHQTNKRRAGFVKWAPHYGCVVLHVDSSHMVASRAPSVVASWGSEHIPRLRSKLQHRNLCKSDVFVQGLPWIMEVLRVKNWFKYRELLGSIQESHIIH